MVKRNSAEFKTIQELIEGHISQASRRRSILLYTLKPYHSLKDLIPLNKIGKDAMTLYDLAYHTLTGYFYDRTKKLFREKDTYFFKSNAASTWIEVPFSFKGKLHTQVKRSIPVELKRVK